MSKEHIFDREIEDINARCKNSGRLLKLQYGNQEINPRWAVLLRYQPNADGEVSDISTYLHTGMSQTEMNFYLQGIHTGLVSLSPRPPDDSPEVEEMRQNILKDLSSTFGPGDAVSEKIDKLIDMIRKGN
jgi:hypothetical protein